jgi:hypothetical protein
VTSEEAKHSASLSTAARFKATLDCVADFEPQNPECTTMLNTLASNANDPDAVAFKVGG